MKPLGRRLLKFTICLLGLAGACAHAAIVSIDGDDVTFTYDDATLFGEAMVIGNNIFFQPTDFLAESLNGEGTVTANETLTVNVKVKPESSGFKLTEFLLAEQGDYKLSGAGSEVDVSGLFKATSQTKLCGLILPCTDQEIFTAGPLTVSGGVLTEWDVMADINLADTSGWVSDTEVNLTLENLLTATTVSDPSQAFVQKKLGGIGVIINPVVPVPASVWLFGSALGFLGWLRRRPQAA